MPIIMSPPSLGSASTHDSLSDCGLEPPDHEVFASGGLKKAVHQHFVSLAMTQEMHDGAPAPWNAAQWNDRMWTDRNMEVEITQLFVDLGMSSNIDEMKTLGLTSFPSERTNGFVLNIWKFRMDRDAKNGRLALSTCTACVQQTLFVVKAQCFAEPAVDQSSPP